MAKNGIILQIVLLFACCCTTHAEQRSFYRFRGPTGFFYRDPRKFEAPLDYTDQDAVFLLSVEPGVEQSVELTPGIKRFVAARGIEPVMKKASPYFYWKLAEARIDRDALLLRMIAPRKFDFVPKESHPTIFSEVKLNPPSLRLWLHPVVALNTNVSYTIAESVVQEVGVTRSNPESTFLSIALKKLPIGYSFVWTSDSEVTVKFKLSKAAPVYLAPVRAWEKAILQKDKGISPSESAEESPIPLDIKVNWFEDIQSLFKPAEKNFQAALVFDPFILPRAFLQEAVAKEAKAFIGIAMKEADAASASCIFQQPLSRQLAFDLCSHLGKKGFAATEVLERASPYTYLHDFPSSIIAISCRADGTDSTHFSKACLEDLRLAIEETFTEETN